MIVQDGLRRMVDRAGGRLLLPDRDERELLAARAARGRRGGHPPRHAPGARGHGRRAAGAAARARGAILREVLAAADLLPRSTTSSRRRLERHQLHRAAPRRHGGRALEPPAPRTRAARALRRPQLSRARGPGGGRDRLHARLRRRHPPLRAAHLPRARHRRLRAQRLRAPSCGASSRSTATTSRWRRCRRWPPRARSGAASVGKAIQRYEIDPDARGAVADVSEVRVPDLGDFEDVPVIEVLVAPGDTVTPRSR